MNEDFRIFLATVEGEAAAASVGAKRGVASSIMNRPGHLEWKHLVSPLDVIRAGGFDAFKRQNVPYRRAYEAFAPAARAALPLDLRILEEAVRGIYERTEPPSTDAVMYYSPRAQAALHVQDPKRYRVEPAWSFDLLEEVFPLGMLPTDDFRFFKYRKAIA